MIMDHKTFAFDLDGTLCSLSGGNYEMALPIKARISHVNSLHNSGHTIIIFTARGATSGRDLYSFTAEQLNVWGVKFDYLIMGKPHFDLLIDDKAVSSTSYFGGMVLEDD
jgi:ribonucleotide monophosphatase NagD (HAD superfamily)